jgi:hypothetical protein
MGKVGRPVSDQPELIAALEPLVRRVRTDVTAKKDDKGMSWTREPLTERRLAKHLNGGPARGVCPIKAGESVTLVGLLDLDSHKGESTWEEMSAAALRVVEELEARFMDPVCFRSSGGRGIHIYVLWDEPQDAYSVRQELIEAIGALGFNNGTAGVSRGEIEVFPKQNSVPADGFGNQFILPLAGASEPLDAQMQPMGKAAAVALAWPVSVPVPVRDTPVRNNTSSMQIDDLGLLERALHAIPNDSATGPDRDAWFRIMCAFKEGGGDVEIARAWTMQHPSYEESKFNGPWESIKVGREDGTPVDYLFRVASQHGFHEHIAAEFPIIEVAVDAGAPEPQDWPAFTRDNKGRIEVTVTNTVLAVRRPDMTGLQLAYD